MREERRFSMSTAVSIKDERLAAVPEQKKVRGDTLPEYARYRDDGCDIHPMCLTCPLPRCRFEEPGGLRALLNEYRDQQIVELRLQGVPVDDLAGRFGVSRRTVFRGLEARGHRAAARENPVPAPVPAMYIRRPAPQRQEVRREVRCA